MPSSGCCAHVNRHWSLEDVNVEGARTLARLSKEAGVEKFIQVSLNMELLRHNDLSAA